MWILCGESESAEGDTNPLEIMDRGGPLASLDRVHYRGGVQILCDFRLNLFVTFVWHSFEFRYL